MYYAAKVKTQIDCLSNTNKNEISFIVSGEMELRTNQVGALKIIMDTIKDLLLDANFMFTEKGATIQAMDNSNSSFIYLFLDPEQISKQGSYSCTNETCAGISIYNFHKVLKTAKGKLQHRTYTQTPTP